MKYVILTAYFVGMVYTLANGIVAIHSPGKWLRASWTATRGMKPDMSDRSIRLQGVIHLLIGGVIALAIGYYL